jgi:ABC-type branched-subunit amino acid transport system permease subunit
VRALVGLVIGIVLFTFGVPVLQALVRMTGWFDQPNTEQACLGLILIVLCVIAAQLPGRTPPPSD